MRGESQVIGPRANLGYPSLRDYRYAANEREFFSDSLDQTADHFVLQAPDERAE
jgi:hypothetical protein